MQEINIGIIGNNKSGKSTFINSLFSKELCSEKDFYISENGCEFGSDKNISHVYFEINTNSENFRNLKNYNLDLYFYIFKKFDDYEAEKIKFIENVICQNNNGNIILLQNIDDNNEDSDSAEDYEIIENNNAIKTNIYSLFLHRILQFNNEDVSESVNSALNKKIRLLLGEIEFKKNKNNLSTFEGKKKYLKNKLTEIYETSMIETKFNEIKEKVNNIISENYDKFFNKHVENNLIALKSNNNLLHVLGKLCELIPIIKQNNIMQNMEIIESIFQNELKILLEEKITTPTTISNELITKAELFNTIYDSKLSQEIETLKLLRRDNLILIFENKFESGLMEEIYERLTDKILYNSLSNTLTSDYPFESYLNIMESIADISNVNLNYIALTSVFFVKYIKHNQKIFKYKLGKFMMNEKNSQVEFILYHIYENIKFDKSCYCNNYHNIEDFNANDDLLNKFYETIISIFNEKNIVSTDDIEKYICRYSDSYDFPITTKLFIENIYKETKNIKDTLKKIKKMHFEGKLYDRLISLQDEINLKITENPKFKKIKKGVKKNFVLTGKKSDFETVKKVSSVLKAYESDIRSKDIIEYLQIYGDYFEINNDVIYGLYKIEDSDDDSSKLQDYESSEESETELKTKSKKKTTTKKTK